MNNPSKRKIAAFTGAQSTGKSTLLNLIEKGSIEGGWIIIPEITRTVMSNHNVSINEDGDAKTQLLIFNEYLKIHLNLNSHNRNVFMDRCILDPYIYSLHLVKKGRIPRWVSNYGAELVDMLIGDIDYIFYTSPDGVPLVDDGTRSVDHNFRNSIISIFDSMIPSSISEKIITLSGSVNDRIDIIQASIYSPCLK